jgi:hypothetical protein
VHEGGTASYDVPDDTWTASCERRAREAAGPFRRVAIVAMLCAMAAAAVVAFDVTQTNNTARFERETRDAVRARANLVVAPVAPRRVARPRRVQRPRSMGSAASAVRDNHRVSAGTSPLTARSLQGLPEVPVRIPRS